MNKLVLFSFDYELFLGKNSGSVSQCLLTPTKLILKALKKRNYKGIFFIDTVYLIRLKELARNNELALIDWTLITQQINTIVNDGHYIFPHIHPHWIDAHYDSVKNEWNLTNKSLYRFNSVSKPIRMKLFQESLAILSGITSNKVSLTQMDAYRAGGWSIQPFEDFKPIFEQFGVLNEFSVIPGKFQISDAHFFDFRSVNRTSPYKFEDDPCKPNNNGKYTEWPISDIKLNKMEIWINFKVNGIIQRIWSPRKLSGSTVDLTLFEEGNSLCNPSENRMLASFEGLNPFLVLKFYLKIFKVNYFQFISHPKMLSSFDFIMIRLLLLLLSKFKIQTDFKKRLPYD